MNRDKIRSCWLSGILTVALTVAVNMSGQSVIATAATPDRLTAQSNPSMQAADPLLSAQANFGKLPATFIPNSGQIDSIVRFEMHTSAGSLFFTPGGVTLSLPITESSATKIAVQTTAPGQLNHARLPEITSAIAIKLMFTGSNPNVLIEGGDPLPGTTNFIIGRDRTRWHTDMRTYSGIIYRNMYPGIDLNYTGHTGILKGTYTVAAGANPDLIRWHYAGADEISLDNISGDLRIQAASITLTEQIPQVWQIRADGSRMAVVAHYQIDSSQTARFVVGDYDHGQPLIIDPGLVYSTYLGGAGNEVAYAIALDNTGAAYIAGSTSSVDFPTTTGSYQIGANSGTEAFVTKLNPAGNAIVYSTYLGGNGNDYAFGVAADANGYTYITGNTASTDFPTSIYAVGPNLRGTYNAFVTELFPAGNGVYYSTYLGGSGKDEGLSIKVDTNFRAYVTGDTTSNNFPTTYGAYHTAAYGGDDAFAAELNPNGTGLVYSTVLGGSNNDGGTALVLDSSNDAYVSGYTCSSNFPTSGNPYQAASGGGCDAFMAEFNPSGSTLLYSTYLGGSGTDSSTGIALDKYRYVYVTGYTNGSFPTTTGVFQTSVTSGYHAFVTQFDPLPSKTLYYSTYLGGNGLDEGMAIAVDSLYQAHITGYTTSTNFPTTAGAFQTTLAGTKGAFVTVLNYKATALVSSTYLSGNDKDWGLGIAVDRNGDTYVTGNTGSTNFPVLSPIQSTNHGGWDVFLTKLNTLAGRIDSIGIYRAGTFYLRLHNSTGIADLTIAFTRGTRPYPIVGDWTGVGYDTVGVFDQGNGQFTLCTANVTTNCADVANQKSLVLGVPSDQPLSGRWSIDATNSGVGVFRPSNGLIYLKSTLTTGYADDTMVLGVPGDVGLAGDWNGKGFDSPGVYRPTNSAFYLSNQVTNGNVVGDYQMAYGLGGDTPVIGDWIAQGHDGIGLFRQSTGLTYLKNGLTTGYADNSFTYGIAGDIPIAGHWQATYPPAALMGQLTAPPSVLIAKTPTALFDGVVPNDGTIGD